MVKYISKFSQSRLIIVSDLLPRPTCHLRFLFVAFFFFLFVCPSVSSRVSSDINNFYYPDNGYIRIFGI